MLISKDHLRARHSVSKDESRPVLQIIDVRREGDEVIAAATNGYILTEVRQSSEFDVEEFPQQDVGRPINHVRISGDSATKLKATMKSDKDLPILGYGLVTDGGVVTTNLKRITVFDDRQPEGNFPMYQELIPSSSDAVAKVSLNPKLLADLLKSFDGINSVELELHGAMKGVVVRSGGSDLTVTGVIMPLKA